MMPRTVSEFAAAFAGFRGAVFDDFHLMMRLRRPLDRDAYVAQAIAAGAACGFVFDEATVHAALRDGETLWQTPGAETS